MANCRSSLTKEQRIEYTTAVQCLQKKPNQISNEQIPGARSRFDDVIATHLLQTPYIHFSVRIPTFPVLVVAHPRTGPVPPLASHVHVHLR